MTGFIPPSRSRWVGPTAIYEFLFAGGAAFGVPDPDYLSNTTDARKATLGAALEDCGARSLHYVYDFGDYWDYIVSVERIETASQVFLIRHSSPRQANAP